jgi:hypothetical protein
MAETRRNRSTKPLRSGVRDTLPGRQYPLYRFKIPMSARLRARTIIATAATRQFPVPPRPRYLVSFAYENAKPRRSSTTLKWSKAAAGMINFVPYGPHQRLFTVTELEYLRDQLPTPRTIEGFEVLTVRARR